jgi:hypothetical protein
MMAHFFERIWREEDDTLIHSPRKIVALVVGRKTIAAF